VFQVVGNIIGKLLYGLFSDRYIKYKKVKGDTKPELRLPPIVLGAVGFPLGLSLYGWAMNKDVHWIMPFIKTAIAGFSMLLSILPTENYLVDLFDPPGTSASAIAAGVITRGLLAAILPLAGPSLYDSLGHGWGNTLLAFISAVFIPPLVVLWRYGDFLRERRC
jgi:MFS family permease